MSEGGMRFPVYRICVGVRNGEELWRLNTEDTTKVTAFHCLIYLKPSEFLNLCSWHLFVIQACMHVSRIAQYHMSCDPLHTVSLAAGKRICARSQRGATG